VRGLFFLTSLGLSFVGVRGSVTAGIAPKPRRSGVGAGA
jgi:hypothetical protein